jgi:geranylgeranyl diphosphate synthase type II
MLARYRALAVDALLAELPSGADPPYLYDLLRAYPSRPSKGLRAAICLATCAALGGEPARALGCAAAIELFHNAFLVHDDIQDGSVQRRGEPTLHELHGVSIALNVGNATNLAGLQRIMANRSTLGGELAWRVFVETETMLRHSLEGQAIELAWIRDNVCDLAADDYYRMCLKKTSWYTCVYPLRVGALVAGGGTGEVTALDTFGWYVGAAFQIQDDVLNLVGDGSAYGKEILGDLREGKRTLALIHLLDRLGGAERRRLHAFLGRTRTDRGEHDVLWVREMMVAAGSVDYARRCARALADAATDAGAATLSGFPDGDDKAFLLALPDYVVTRDR